MNQIMQDYFPTFEHYQALRAKMLDLLSDADLAHKFEGSPSLGGLCQDIGETEQSYINSFKAFKLDFSYKQPDASLATSTSALAAWYANLDKELKALIEGYTDQDLNRPIDRGGWNVPVRLNLDIYKEALLIFYGKAWVHLQALGKTLPEQWREWIG